MLPRLEALLAGASTAGVHFVQCSAIVCLVNAHCICVIAPCCSHGGSSCGHAALPELVMSGRALAMASLPSSDGAVARSVQDSFGGLREFLSMLRLSLKGCCSGWLRGRVLAGRAHGLDRGVRSLCQSPPPRPPWGTAVLGVRCLSASALLVCFLLGADSLDFSVSRFSRESVSTLAVSFVRHD